MGRVIRVVGLVVLLGILAFVVWLRVTREGRDLAGDMSDRTEAWRHGSEEKDAAEKLKAMGAIMVRSAARDQSFASIDCKDKTLGDEGYRLVGKCFGLQAAAFTHCDLNDDRIQNLAGLRHLSSLTIFDTPAVTDAGLKHVARLRELQALNLEKTGVGDAGLASIAQLPDLRILDLSYTRVTDAGMPSVAALATLATLWLVDTQVTDEGLARLDGLSELKEINLTGTKVTDAGKAHLRKAHPGLRVL